MLMVAAALVCLVVHFYFGWKADIQEAAMHGESALFRGYITVWLRDTFENLQSEFWQLAVQMLLLAGFFEAVRVKAYEKDNEEIRSLLNQVLENQKDLDK